MKKLFKYTAPPLTTFLLIASFIQSCGSNNNSTPTPSSSTPWWDEIDNYSDEQISKLQIGTTKEVKVNGINHKVRLIDINHDILTSDTQKKARTTWEFVNPICDKNGYSLTTFWDDHGDKTHHYNTHFTSSTLKYAIDGEISDNDVPNQAIWYTMNSSIKSTEYTKPIIDMLPQELVSKLKEVNKIQHEATLNSGTEWDPTNTDEFITYSTKLFIASITEVSTDERTEETNYKDGYIYEFYNENPNQAKRLKHQIKGSDGSKTGRCNIYITDSTYPYSDGGDAALNFAGYQTPRRDDGEGHYIDFGCNYWLRSPRWNNSMAQLKQNTVDAYYINESGDLKQGFTNLYSLPVAPCFCI